MRVAVVGHIEWVEFVRVGSVPLSGQIVHALETWEEPAGGGAVAAVQLARLAGSCSLAPGGLIDSSMRGGSSISSEPSA